MVTNRITLYAIQHFKVSVDVHLAAVKNYFINIIFFIKSLIWFLWIRTPCIECIKMLCAKFQVQATIP